MKTLTPLLLTVILCASVSIAQSKKDKIEIGVQSTSLTLFNPDFPADDVQTGFGGRFTYNFNRSIAAEAEVNFFPQKQFILISEGNAIQAQFGMKIGKRFEKAGVFGKVRPGFLSVDRVGFFIPGPNLGQFDVKFERQTFFSTDFGGVLELYPSKRTVVRFDAGDTVLRHPARFNIVSIPTPAEPVGVQFTSLLSRSKQKETISRARSFSPWEVTSSRDSLVARLGSGLIDGAYSAKRDPDSSGLRESLMLSRAHKLDRIFLLERITIRHSMLEVWLSFMSLRGGWPASMPVTR